MPIGYVVIITGEGHISRRVFGPFDTPHDAEVWKDLFNPDPRHYAWSIDECEDPDVAVVDVILGIKR